MNAYKNRYAVVVGLARSGMAAARLLKKLGARVGVSDEKTSRALELAAAGLRQEGVAVELGGHSRAFLKACDYLVLSPGARLDSRVVSWARESGADVLSEIELAWRHCPATVIAVTGTNGKTTTTTLMGDVIRAAGRRAFVCGNIGTPFSDYVSEMKKEDFVVLEASSFQLEAISTFRPHVAVILNVTPDHLDRYRSVLEYGEAKMRIYMNQGPQDWLVLNETDETLRLLAPAARGGAIFFGLTPAEDADFNQNQQAVLAVARVLEIDRRICLDVFKDFKGVEHRMEFVRDLEGVEYVNDSKATNIDSTVWALRNVKKPVILIAGGRDKGSDFASITALVREKVKFAVLVGESSERIARAWQGVVPCEAVKSFEEAVRAARVRAARGECVLFSPMCKSFDMFTDYEHRGRTFKEVVARLT